MRTRDAVLLYQEVQTDTATKILDIDLADPISAFYIEVHSTNGATSNKDNFISDIVTKIEVVDGSDVLASLNMFQLEALHFYKTGKVPVLFPSEWGGGQQRHGVLLLFGHYLWDPTLCMVPTRYKNPQLKVTFNKAVIRAAGATGFASGNNIYLTVVAKLIEEGASPVGFLMQKQIESFTSTTSGDKRIELPTDYPYSMLLCRFYVSGSDIDEVITDFKMTCDTDKFIPFNRKVKQLDAEALATFGPVDYKHDFLRSGSTTAVVFANKEPWITGFVRNPGTPRVIVPWAQWSSNYNLELYDMAGALDGTDRQITGHVHGHALHATLPVLFGIYGNPVDYFPAKKYGKIELVLTQAVAATCEIVLEQLR